MTEDEPICLTLAETRALAELIAMLATIEDRGLRHDHVIEISRELWRDMVMRPAEGLRRVASRKLPEPRG